MSLARADQSRKPRRVRVFSSPCCKVVSELPPKYPGESLSLAMCSKCFLVHSSENIDSWLQDLMALPLGSPAPE